MDVDYKNGDLGVKKSLFGGAMSCFLPENARDMSDFREVPDNQEVFQHDQSDQSLMIDILEYQSHVQGEEAIKYHYYDIADANEAARDTEVILIEPVSTVLVQMKQCSEVWYLFGRQKVSKYNEGPDAKNLIHVLVLLYRLPQFQTDILVIMNDPVTISEKSSSLASTTPPDNDHKWSEELFKQIACSLDLVDTSLFG